MLEVGMALSLHLELRGWEMAGRFQTHNGSTRFTVAKNNMNLTRNVLGSRRMLDPGSDDCPGRDFSRWSEL
jgi:hypothetical protein